MLSAGVGQHLGKTPWGMAARCTSSALVASPRVTLGLAQEESPSVQMVSRRAAPCVAVTARQRDGLSLQDRDPVSPSCLQLKEAKVRSVRKKHMARQDETKTAHSQTSMKIRTQRMHEKKPRQARLGVSATARE